MAINWDNVKRLRTRDGRKVLGAWLISHGIYKLVCVAVRNSNGEWYSYFAYQDGRHRSSASQVMRMESPNDIIELPPDPPKPREVIRWTHPGVFDDGGSLLWTRKTTVDGNSVRVRIIEEPEVE
jgi:hypothetical protein